MSLKVWLDDVRPAPDGWEQVLWPCEMIELLKKGNVTNISLDHDLGDDGRGTGYDVLLWIAEEIAMQSFQPPEIKVHSANVSARQKMESAIKKIESMKRTNSQARTLALLEEWYRCDFEKMIELPDLVFFINLDTFARGHIHSGGIISNRFLLVSVENCLIDYFSNPKDLINAGWVLEQDFMPKD